MPKATPRKPANASESFALSKGMQKCVAGALVIAVIIGLSHHFSPSEDAADGATGTPPASTVRAVKQLDDASFDEFVTTHQEGALVEFYSQDCKFCKKLEPEYEAAAKELRNGGPPLASVDAATGAQIMQKFSIERYPTVFWFWKGENVMELPRASEKTAAKIAEWAKWAATPAVQELDTRAEFEEALPTLRSSLHAKARLMVAFQRDEADAMRDPLEATAQRHRSTTVFLYIKGSTDGPSLRSYGQDESKDEDYTGAANRDDVTQWVKAILEKAKPKEAEAKPADPKSAATQAIKQAQQAMQQNVEAEAKVEA